MINNRAVLDIPGEYVCSEEGGVARVSYIAPDGYDDTAPVMTQVNKIITVRDSEHISVEGLEFVHTHYHGLDRGMNWHDAALVVSTSHGRIHQENTSSYHHHCRYSDHQQQVLAHSHDGIVCHHNI